MYNPQMSHILIPYRNQEVKAKKSSPYFISGSSRTPIDVYTGIYISEIPQYKVILLAMKPDRRIALWDNLLSYFIKTIIRKDPQRMNITFDEKPYDEFFIVNPDSILGFPRIERLERMNIYIDPYRENVLAS